MNAEDGFDGLVNVRRLDKKKATSENVRHYYIQGLQRAVARIAGRQIVVIVTKSCDCMTAAKLLRSLANEAIFVGSMLHRLTAWDQESLSNSSQLFLAHISA
jgi:hypothetical protein